MAERVRALKMTEENRRWWTLGAMCFALFMIMLDNTVVNVALPSIQRGLHASTASLEWTVNAYTLAFAVLLVTGGRLGERPVGQVASSTVSPQLGPIALALLRREAEPGAVLSAGEHGDSAEVVALPFALA